MQLPTGVDWLEPALTTSNVFDRRTQVFIALATCAISFLGSSLISACQVRAGREDDADERLSKVQEALTRSESAHRSFASSLRRISLAKTAAQKDEELTASMNALHSPALDMQSSWVVARNDLRNQRAMSDCLDKIADYFEAISTVPRPASWNDVNGAVVDQEKVNTYLTKNAGTDIHAIDTIDPQSTYVSETIASLKMDIGNFRDGREVSGSLNCDRLLFTSS